MAETQITSFEMMQALLSIFLCSFDVCSGGILVASKDMGFLVKYAAQNPLDRSPVLMAEPIHKTLSRVSIS